VDGAGFGSSQLLARRGRRLRAVLPLWWSERESACGGGFCVGLGFGVVICTGVRVCEGRGVAYP
jgi:hypothetical protein